MRVPCSLLLAAALAAAGDDEPPPGADPAREAPAERVVTLVDAIDLGLRYNLGLESERLAALGARLRVDEADAAFDALLTAGASGGEDLVPSRSTLAGATVVDTDTLAFSVGLEKPLRFGPTLGLFWRSDRTFTNSTFSSVNPAYESQLELSLVVPLLRGRGRGAQEAVLRAERAAAEGARHGLAAEAATLVSAIAAAYYESAYREGRVEVLRKSVQVAREVEEAERQKLRPDVGRATPLDVIKAEAETRRREAELIQGIREAADAADDLRRLVLPFTGGGEDALRLRALPPDGDATPPPALETLVASALERRPELLAADAELRRLHEAVVAAKDATRARLDFSGNVVSRAVDRQFNDTIGDAGAFDTLSAGASLDLVYPLGRRQAKAAFRRAELERERGRVDRLERVNDVVAEVRRAHRAVASAIEEIAATEGEVRAATEALRGERERLARGASTVLVVSEIEENLTEAEVRLLQARVTLAQARVELDRVAGVVLERFGVRLGDELRAGRGP